MTRDPYQQHRPALAPLLPHATGEDLTRAIVAAKEIGEARFIQFVLQQGLAPLWDKQLEDYRGAIALAPPQRELLHQSRLHTTGRYLIQRHQLQRTRDTLDGAGLVHVVAKGAHTREVYYANAALRPALDIDIFVHPRDKITAIKALQSDGFTFFGVADNISHECSLIKGSAAIDLHWDILRPGRTRQPLLEELLAGRVDYGSHWGMNPSADLFLMLVHPVFTKYSTTTQASLSRMVDLALLLDKNLADQSETSRLLTAAGLKTAGWITARWFYLLSGSALCRDLAQELNPGRLRQRYLNNWLHNNRASRLMAKPLRIQLGFTLPAHDKASDAIRAVRQARQCRREGQQILKKIEGEI